MRLRGCYRYCLPNFPEMTWPLEEIAADKASDEFLGCNRADRALSRHLRVHCAMI